MNSLICIKPKSLKKVKTLGLVSILLFGLQCFAQEPILQVRTYKVEVKKRSATQRVYLLQAYDGEPSVQNTVILLRTLDTGENTMAFRVIRNYEDDLFAVTRVRSYSGHPVLEVSDRYLALEKVGETYLPTEREKAQDEKELQDLEKGMQLEILEYDPDLDAGTSPTVEAIEESLRDIVIDEINRYDTLKNWFTLQFALLKNFSNETDQTAMYSGMGIRYGRTVGEALFFSDADAQDSLVLEGGIFYYKIVPFEPNTFDSFSIMPIIGTIRYNIHFSEKIALSAHIGLMRNIILSSNNSTEDSVALLSSWIAAFGLGAYIELGPKWDLRFDLGLDIIGAGLVLRF